MKWIKSRTVNKSRHQYFNILLLVISLLNHLFRTQLSLTTSFKQIINVLSFVYLGWRVKYGRIALRIVSPLLRLFHFDNNTVTSAAFPRIHCLHGSPIILCGAAARLPSRHKVRTYKEYHSVCPSLELGLSQPLSCQRVFPSPQKQGGGGTLACGWGVGGSPNSDEGHTLWYSLYVRTLCLPPTHPRREGQGMRC